MRKPSNPFPPTCILHNPSILLRNRYIKFSAKLKTFFLLRVPFFRDGQTTKWVRSKSPVKLYFALLSNSLTAVEAERRLGATRTDLRPQPFLAGIIKVGYWADSFLYCNGSHQRVHWALVQWFRASVPFNYWGHECTGLQVNVPGRDLLPRFPDNQRQLQMAALSLSPARPTNQVHPAAACPACTKCAGERGGREGGERGKGCFFMEIFKLLATTLY